MNNEVNVPDEVQVFRYEGGDLNYQPWDSAPKDWDGNLNDLIGDYISVESIDLIRSQEHQRTKEVLTGLHNGTAPNRDERYQMAWRDGVDAALRALEDPEQPALSEGVGSPRNVDALVTAARAVVGERVDAGLNQRLPDNDHTRDLLASLAASLLAFEGGAEKSWSARLAEALNAVVWPYAATKQGRCPNFEEVPEECDCVACKAVTLLAEWEDSADCQPLSRGVGSGAGVGPSESDPLADRSSDPAPALPASAAPSVQDDDWSELWIQRGDPLNPETWAIWGSAENDAVPYGTDGRRRYIPAPPPQAVQGQTCEMCGGSRKVAGKVLAGTEPDVEVPCPACQPEKGGEGKRAGDLTRWILDALERPADDPSDRESYQMQQRIEAAIKSWEEV